MFAPSSSSVILQHGPDIRHCLSLSTHPHLQAKSKSRQQSYHKLVKKTAKKDEVKGLSLEAAKARLGNFVLAFDDAKLRFEAAGGKQILDGFTYEFERGDRVGIVGPNGVGKRCVRCLV